ncbi:MAG: hypothetical protein Q8873_09035 [Bacillota bacterium]|nr:hypothetical protein [Bacillota bacterium]
MNNLARVDLGEVLRIYGTGTVFVGIVCIIATFIICKVLIKRQLKEEIVAELKTTVVKTTTTAETKTAYEAKKVVEIPDRQKFIAAVSAVIAENMGTDISAIRILSVKKL